MTATATKPVPKIDPDLEKGSFAFAETVLDPDPSRTKLALIAQAAEAHLSEARARVNTALERQHEISAALNEGPSADERRKLEAERRGLTADLMHGPADVAAAAQLYADALIAWARPVITAARTIIRQTRKEQNPLRREAARLFSKIEVSLPTRSAPSVTEAEEIRKKRAALWEKITPLQEREEQAVDLESRASTALTIRFGEGEGGSVYREAGVREWVEGVRRSYSRRTGQFTGVSDALKPRGW